MGFDAASFYSVADELRLKSRADGPHLRTLISRAYYGALIVARDARQIPTKGEKSGHQSVINAFAGVNAQDDAVADSLRTLRSLRERADYEPACNLSGSDGDRALSSSRRVLQTLNAFPARPGK